jgi:SH3-like domain-containing protein
MKSTAFRRLAALTLAAGLGLALFARLEAADMQQPTASAASTAFGAGFRKGRETGFPVPRFVSIKSASARMRVGPSTDYPTVWVYSARGLPLEITEEYGNWRQVRDQDGTTGWMSAALLSGNRTAVVGPWHDKPVPLRREPSKSAGLIAALAPNVRLNLKTCDGSWCDVSLQTQRVGGYVAQADLWGVYPQERVE